jgi:hemerythrin-like domain-containing protein
MKPRGPLMTEHRLIEKMLDIANMELASITKTKKVNVVFIETVVDFIKTYADRTHHGKEEDILFTRLADKKMNPDDAKMMQDLVDEHTIVRKWVGELVDANKKYADGDVSVIGTIADKLSDIIKFYPGHILKEDKIFFINTEKYFTEDELNDMLSGFWEFDRKMIHEKYSKLYESLKMKYAT